MIPLELKESLDRYVMHRVPTGNFLCAVLANNLMEAFGRADINNRYLLFDICSYVYNEIPVNCYGSEEKVNAWLKEGPTTMTDLAPHWVKCSEGLPERARWYWCRVPGEGGGSSYNLECFLDAGGSWSDHSEEYVYVTHWLGGLELPKERP